MELPRGPAAQHGGRLHLGRAKGGGRVTLDRPQRRRRPLSIWALPPGGRGPGRRAGLSQLLLPRLAARPYLRGQPRRPGANDQQPAHPPAPCRRAAHAAGARRG
ncbi:hypothetical protein G6F35_017586 [Rhizopus arrhizus]|nr:hypothetical protein G6F35_017586 [Rhizopus arrhizus]